jgi:GAF domain-containing protein
VADEQSRLHRLIEAGIALSSELSLDALLQRLAETAAELTGARYAALGVIDPTGRELERFLTHGIDPETHAAIGDLPRGRGILGVLIRESRPLRLGEIAQDPRSVGFPPHHPPMKTFLGVPVMLRGVAYGNLYLTEKEGGADFTGEDEEIVTLLASQAAVAIENARLYESSRAWARQLESLNEITAAMVSEVEPRKLGCATSSTRASSASGCRRRRAHSNWRRATAKAQKSWSAFGCPLIVRKPDACSIRARAFAWIPSSTTRRSIPSSRGE